MMFQGFGYGQGHGVFYENYRCYSIASSGKKDKEKGDKIILPASAFEKLGTFRFVSLTTRNFSTLLMLRFESEMCDHKGADCKS